jgi:uncharacterized ubiquitin-like protein YukD
MSLVAAKQKFFVPEIIPQPYSFGIFTLNATGERCGQIMQIWKAGNIRKVHFMTQTVTTGDTMKVTLQTVDAASGLPSGSLIDAEATGTVAVENGDDNVWKTVDFGEAPVAVPVTQGQYIAVSIEFNSYGSGNLALRTNYYTPLSALLAYNVYTVSDITASPGTWVKETGGQSLAISLEYDDGTFHNGLDYIGPSNTAAVTISTSTNPDEVGNYMQSPFPFRAVGFWVFGDFDYNVTLQLLSADDTILANATIEADYRNAAAAAIHHIAFDGDPASSVSIAKDTWYRVIVTPGADAVTVQKIASAVSAASLESLPLGANCHWTQATDRDAVTDWAQTTTARCLIGLIGDQLDDGVSSGGSSPRFGDMTGGIK